MAAIDQPRWLLITLVTLAGLVVTAAPFLLQAADGSFGNRQSLTASTLTNIGTTLLLGAVIFFLERGFIRRVAAEAKQAASDAVDSRTGELAEENRKLAVRLDALQEKFDAGLETVRAVEDDLVRVSGEEVSFDSIAAALEVANGLRALEYGVVTVPLTDGPSSPRVTFSWFERPPVGNVFDGPLLPPLTVELDTRNDRNPGGGYPVVEVHWRANETPDEMLVRFAREMTKAGLAAYAADLGPSLFQNLHAAVFDAVSGRRGDPGSWLRGGLIEWLGDGWALTTTGLESRDYDGIPAAKFPQNTDIRRQSDLPTFRPRRPEGVDKEFWDDAVRRAHEYHGQLRSVMMSGPQETPFTTETSPRARTVPSSAD